MRSILVFFVALFLLGAVSVEAEAANYGRSSISQRRNPAVFGRLVELERRKNAWLRRTFLSR